MREQFDEVWESFDEVRQSFSEDMSVVRQTCSYAMCDVHDFILRSVASYCVQS